MLTHLNRVAGFKIQHKSNLHTNKLLTDAARDGKTLVLKMSQVRRTPIGRNGRPIYDYFNGFMRENVTHFLLCHVAYGGVRGSDLVPMFYFSGAVKARDGSLWYVTVMDQAPGTTLKTLVESRATKSLTSREYVSIERALLSLWLLGVVHADMHMSNIMYDPKTEKVTILDLGFAVPLPQDVIEFMRANTHLMGDVDAEEIYEGVHDFVHHTIKRRLNNIKQFNTDGGLLVRLRGMVHDTDNIRTERSGRALIAGFKGKSARLKKNHVGNT